MMLTAICSAQLVMHSVSTLHSLTTVGSVTQAAHPTVVEVEISTAYD
jgi:hypothetical protein